MGLAVATSRIEIEFVETVKGGIKSVSMGLPFEPHDYNAMPLALLGCEIQIHEKLGSVSYVTHIQVMGDTFEHPVNITCVFECVRRK